MQSAKQAMEQPARKYCVTYEEVYQEIEAAIAEALGTTDPKSRAIWAGISCQGNTPTPIELIEYLRDYCVAQESAAVN